MITRFQAECIYAVSVLVMALCNRRLGLVAGQQMVGHLAGHLAGRVG